MLIKINLKKFFSLIFFVFRIFPINNKKVYFQNFKGKGYGDNPKYISELLLKYGDYEIVWGCDNLTDYFPCNIKKVKLYSLRWFYEVTTSKIWVMNIRIPLFMKKRKKQFYIQTWHGGLAIKKIELDAKEKLDYYYLNVIKNDTKYIDALISNSKFNTQMYKSAFGINKNIYEFGSPRNDIFYNEDLKAKARKDVKKFFHLDNDPIIILYAPTFRTSKDFDYFQFSIPSIIDICEKKYNRDVVFLVRMHPNVKQLSPYNSNKIKDANLYPDMYELLSVTDILISDYSSVILDFMILKKPIFMFIPDYCDYLDERGVYINSNEMPFPAAYNESQLLSFIKHDNYNLIQVERFIEQFGIIDDGNASYRVFKMIEEMSNGRFLYKD